MRITVHVDKSEDEFYPYNRINRNGNKATTKRTSKTAFGNRNFFREDMDESQDDESGKSDMSESLGSQDTDVMLDTDDVDEDTELVEISAAQPLSQINEVIDLTLDEEENMDWDVKDTNPAVVSEALCELYNEKRITLDDFMSILGAYKKGDRILKIPKDRTEDQKRFNKRRKLN